MSKILGYYDMDFDVELLAQNGGIDEVFRLHDIQNRKFYLMSDIDYISVFDIVRHILQINREDILVPADARRPIVIYIASNGGEVDAGFQLIDAIENSVTPVYTVNLSNAYSMGFLICLAGKKRFAMPNAKFLMHDGSNFVYGTGTKVQDQMEFQKKVDSRVRDYILSHSKLSPEEYDAKLRVEWFMFADEAKEKGFVDAIVGTDVSISNIV